MVIFPQFWLQLGLDNGNDFASSRRSIGVVDKNRAKNIGNMNGEDIVNFTYFSERGIKLRFFFFNGVILVFLS